MLYHNNRLSFEISKALHCFVILGGFAYVSGGRIFAFDNLCKSSFLEEFSSSTLWLMGICAFLMIIDYCSHKRDNSICKSSFDSNPTISFFKVYQIIKSLGWELKFSK